MSRQLNSCQSFLLVSWKTMHGKHDVANFQDSPPLYHTILWYGKMCSTSTMLSPGHGKLVGHTNIPFFTSIAPPSQLFQPFAQLMMDAGDTHCQSTKSSQTPSTANRDDEKVRLGLERMDSGKHDKA